MKERQSWLNSPYTFSEKVDFLRYRLQAPRRAESIAALREWQPIRATIDQEAGDTPIRADFSITFTGDLMPFGSQPLVLDDALDEWLRSSTYVVYNLEGVVSDRRRLLALSHSSAAIREYLSRHEDPQRVILNVVNNHSSDFGAETFARQNALLRSWGYRLLDDTCQPIVPEESVAIESKTFLSNQPVISTIPYLSSKSILSNSRPMADTHYRIMLPHWGYEMHLSPESWQSDMAIELIPNHYDAVIGTHPHVPHEAYRRGQNIIATSLGNYCYLNHNPNHWGGSLLRLHFLRRPSQKPILAAAELCYVQQQIVAGQVMLRQASTCDYRSLRHHLRLSTSYLVDLLK